MTTVDHLLKHKGHQIWSVEPESSMLAALELMAEKGVGALLVIKDNQVVGIVSERDYARKVELKGKKASDTLVSTIMTPDVLCINSDQSLEDVMALMSTKKIRHLPVLSEDELIGIISIGDVVNELISAHQFTIGQLENYIKGY